MLFWIKKSLLALFLLIVAVFLLFGKNWKINGTPVDSQANPSTLAANQSAAKIEEEEAFSLTTSSAAKGLSNFYGKIKEDLLGNSTTMGDGYVLKVTPSIYSLDEQLILRGSIVTPGSPTFKGDQVNRHFRAGDTIRTKLIEAAESEGMKLIWQLDKDYVIKYYFQVDANLLSVLGTVASAIDNDFEQDVFAYYCFKQRAVIIAHETSDYIRQHCKLATSRS